MLRDVIGPEGAHVNDRPSFDMTDCENGPRPASTETAALRQRLTAKSSPHLTLSLHRASASVVSRLLEQFFPTFRE
jgi:hypothetical protein